VAGGEYLIKSFVEATMPFDIPAGYFNSLKPPLLAGAPHDTRAVVSLTTDKVQEP